MPKSKIELPSWATLIDPEESVGREPVCFSDEEAFVRTRIFHEGIRRLDLALQETLEAASSRVLECLEPTKKREGDDIDSGKKRSRLSVDDTAMNGIEETEKGSASSSIQSCVWTIDANRKVPDPRLLPIHLLSGPPNPLDRIAWMKYLVTTAQKQRDSNDKAKAVVWLQQGQPSTWPTEIIRQLLLLETPHKSMKSKQLSAIEKIRQWCRYTRQFRSIQIYVDMQTVNSSYPLVNRFLNWLSSLRGTYGIPFSAVVLESSGIRRHDLSSYEQGSESFVVTRDSLPLPEHMFKQLLSHRDASRLFPALDAKQAVSPTAGSALLQTFTSSGSVVYALTEWKRRFAYFLSTPGSFLVFDSDPWLVDERRRIDWMLHSKILHKTGVLKSPSSFEVQLWKKEAATRRSMAFLAWQLRFLVLYDCQEKPPLDLWKYDHADNRKALIKFLAQIREQATVGSTIVSVENAINELIILVEKTANVQEILFCLDFYEEIWQKHLISLPLTSSPLEEYQRAAQPRRDLVGGLQSTAETGAPRFSMVLASLYRAFDNRISIGLSEWMNSSIQEMLTADETEAVALFSVCANMLKILGLVRERRVAGRGDPIFEKTAVVFSSGA